MSDFEIIDHTRDVIEAKNAAAKRALEAVGLHLEGEAKLALESNPRRVDTGLLRNSIAHAVSGEGFGIGEGKAKSYRDDRGENGGSYAISTPGEGPGEMAVYIGTNVEYAPYVHEGTSKMAPNRFIKNAVDANKSQIKNYLEKELRNG